MKAIVSTRYGSPAVMKLQEIDRPGVPDDGVLVRLRATSVNAFVWHMVRGKPYFARLTEGSAGRRRPCSASTWAASWRRSEAT